MATYPERRRKQWIPFLVRVWNPYILEIVSSTRHSPFNFWDHCERIMGTRQTFVYQPEAQKLWI